MKMLFAQRATPIARAGINVEQDAEITEIIDEPHPDFVKSSRLVGSALEHGHLELAQWLLPRADKVSATWLHAAVKGGSLEAVQWVYTLSCRFGSPPGIIDAAVDGKTGNTEILRLLLDRYDGYVDMAAVVSCEDYDTIEWALQCPRIRRYGLKQAAIKAAGRGKLDIVRLFSRYDRATGVNPGATDSAAAYGHLEIVQWLHENTDWGCTTAVMDAAAGNRHLEVVKYLHDNRTEGCTLAAMDTAAGSGHLEVVKWLHVNCSEGCTTRAIEMAAKNGLVDEVKWLIKYRCQTFFALTDAMDSAATEGHLGILQWLADSGQDCTRAAMNGAAANGHLGIVKWLHEKRNEGCTTEAMDNAAKNGHLDVVQWLHSNRTEGCTDAAFRLAVKKGHFQVVHWLHRNIGPNVMGANGLVGAMDTAHFDAVVYVCLECRGDLVVALSTIPRSYMRHWQFVDWLYSHYPHGFASSF